MNTIQGVVSMTLTEADDSSLKWFVFSSCFTELMLKILCSALAFICSRGTQFKAEINKTKRETWWAPSSHSELVNWFSNFLPLYWEWARHHFWFRGRKVMSYCALTNIPVFTDIGKSCSCRTTIQPAWSHLFLYHIISSAFPPLHFLLGKYICIFCKLIQTSCFTCF